jgi:hypothetical protein
MAHEFADDGLGFEQELIVLAAAIAAAQEVSEPDRVREEFDGLVQQLQTAEEVLRTADEAAAGRARPARQQPAGHALAARAAAGRAAGAGDRHQR